MNVLIHDVTYTYMYSYIMSRIHTCTHLYIRPCAHAFMYSYTTHIYIYYIHVLALTSTHALVYSYIHTYFYSHICLPVHMHIQTFAVTLPPSS